MAIEDPPNVCDCCAASVLSCCPTIPETVTFNVTFSNPGSPANTAANVVGTRSACSYTGSVFDAGSNKYLAATLIWTPDDPAVDPHVGEWVATWDDQGYNDNYYTASGSIDWCDPSGPYGPATCDDVLCLDPSATSTLTVASGAAPSNTAPVITPIANQVSEDLDVVSLQVVATDSDNLTYSAVGLPTGISISPTTGLISGTINSSSTSDILDIVTVTVTDDGYPQKSTDETFAWVSRRG